MKSSLFFVHFLIILFTCVSLQTQAQWEHKTYVHDNISRDYWIYIPQSYSSSNPASLVVTLHGMGDNDTNFRAVGFNHIADTANFIVIVPNAVPFNSDNPIVQAVIGGSRTWNSGAGIDIPIVGSVFPNNEINDEGFLNEIVDKTINEYAVNHKRVYMCGFSKGGFMTQRMALKSNGRYAAFATVAGTFGLSLTSPNPGRGIPLAHFNGTLDEKVNWQSGNPMFEVYVDSMVDFWVNHNNCDITPIHEHLPDTHNDGFTVEHEVYANGDNGSALEVFKVNGAGHIWLNENNDINYTTEIWKFFSRYSFETAIISEEDKGLSINIYPNPVTSSLTINALNDCHVLILDVSGKALDNIKLVKGQNTVDILKFNAGTYFIKDVHTGSQVRFIKQ